MSATRLLIFDVDGTLVDSQDMIVESQRRTFLAHGLTPPDRRASLSVVGLSLREAFTVLVGADGPVEGMAETYKSLFGELRAGAGRPEPFFPGAVETVARYGADAGFMLGVATGKSRRGVRHLFERAGWTDFFATVQTADDHPSKPAPDMILAALAETGVAAQDAFMIGDTSFDMAMAKAAGVRAIGVSWGYHETAALEAAGADAIISDFAELDELLAPVPSPRRAGRGLG
ncbi:MAG TPA: HAD-IA family hydrolase [Rhodoblastus sp.]|nr:HAD-IA family hydrolase [Rhodoblastus sp.]